MKAENILGYLNVQDFGASGSKFETLGITVAGSNRIEVADVGDFKVGQQIQLSNCMPRCIDARIFGPRPLHGRERILNNEIELRGWNASNGERVVYYLDIDPDNPTVFRWTDDRGCSWHEDVPVDNTWHNLSGGLEVRFNDFDWSQGWVITLVMQASLITQIASIEDNVLTVDIPVQRSGVNQILHSDTLALQTAIDTALKEGLDLWIPEGTYRLAESLHIDYAKSLTIRGASPERTIMDIGAGGLGGASVKKKGGSCFLIYGGEEVKFYDLGFRGGSGYAMREQEGHRFDTKGATGVWGFYFRKSNAMNIFGTRRVYVENCHARKMSCECFYSKSESRTLENEPEQYTTSITYLRCVVEDCARNAFNNNDFAENTHLIDCRIRDVGGCTWEGSSRFVRMQGCYVRNAGTVGIGNIRNRDESLERLGSGQHVIVDNTFEEGCPYGLAMIGVGAGASQVIIKGNQFINFNSNAIRVIGDTGAVDLPSRNVIISGNSFDMTAEGVMSIQRAAINITASDVTVSDNQIYTTFHDEQVTGIIIRNDVMGVVIHDNLIRGCGEGITYTCVKGEVGSVIDDKHFYREQTTSWHGNPPTLRRRSHRYRGWYILWDNGEKSVMEDFDPENCIFTLQEPHQMKVGEGFIMSANYPDGRIMVEKLIHDNLIV